MPKLTEVPVSTATSDAEPQLIRGVGLWGATTLNMIDMIGVGPFICPVRAVLIAILQRFTARESWAA